MNTMPAIDHPKLPGAILPVLEQATDWLLAHSPADGRLMLSPGVFDHRSWYDLPALAVTYVDPAGRWRGDGRVADLIRRAGRSLVAMFADRSEVNPDGLWWETRADEWIVEAWLRTREILTSAGAGDLAAGWDEPLKMSGRVFARYCREAEHVRRMSSPNLKISTNHFAYFAADAIRLGQTFGESEWLDGGLKTALKINAGQHGDGYWAETHGPTTSYNQVSMAALGLCYEYTGREEFKSTLRRAVDFASRYTYPDGVDLETIDGRTRYPARSTSALFAYSHWADGRGWAENRFRCELPTLRTPAGRAAFGRLTASWLYYHAGPAVTPACFGGDYQAQLSDLPGGIVKRGGWAVGLSGIPTRPRNHHYTMDRQTLISLWHRDCGLILGGGGDRENATAATFHARVMCDPTATVRGITHEDVYVPVNGALALQPDGGELDLEFWGFDATLTARIVDERTCRIVGRTGSLPLNHPITFSLTLWLGVGPLDSGAGPVDLAGDAMERTSGQLGGWIGQGRWRIELPAGATLRYPLGAFRTNKKTQSVRRLALLSVVTTNAETAFTVTVR